MAMTARAHTMAMTARAHSMAMTARAYCTMAMTARAYCTMAMTARASCTMAMTARVHCTCYNCSGPLYMSVASRRSARRPAETNRCTRVKDGAITGRIPARLSFDVTAAFTRWMETQCTTQPALRAGFGTLLFCWEYL